MSSRSFVKAQRKAASRRDSAKASVRADRAHTMAQLRPRPAYTSGRGPSRKKGGENFYYENATYTCLATGTSNGPALVGATAQASTPGTGLFNVICLNSGLAAGDVNNTRHGRRYRITAIALRGYVPAVNASLSPALQSIKMALVWSRKPHSQTNLPAWSDIFRVSGTANDPCQLSSITNAPDFKILKLWDLGHLQTGSPTLPNVFDSYLPMKNKEVVLKSLDTTGYYSGMEQGALLLCAISEGATTLCAVANTPTQTGSAPGIILNFRIYHDGGVA